MGLTSSRWEVAWPNPVGNNSWGTNKLGSSKDRSHCRATSGRRRAQGWQQQLHWLRLSKSHQHTLVTSSSKAKLRRRLFIRLRQYALVSTSSSRCRQR